MRAIILGISDLRPRIRIDGAFGAWMCYSNSGAGFGPTPKAAYAQWARLFRSAR